LKGWASRTGQFVGPTQENLALSTAELDFDIKLSDWLTGASGSPLRQWHWRDIPDREQSVVPTTTPGLGVDRFTA